MTEQTITRGNTVSGAVYSEDERYRYLLWRKWDDRPAATFLMLNPSTATEAVLDPTVMRCRMHARAWGYGGLVVANLFAYRATDPRELLTLDDPVGPANDATISHVIAEAPLLVCAWGAHGDLNGRARQVLDLLRDTPLYVLGLTKGGQPRHPLYMRADLEPRLWDPRTAEFAYPSLGARADAAIRRIEAAGGTITHPAGHIPTREEVEGLEWFASLGVEKGAQS